DVERVLDDGRLRVAAHVLHERLNARRAGAELLRAAHSAARAAVLRVLVEVRAVGAVAACLARGAIAVRLASGRALPVRAALFRGARARIALRSDVGRVAVESGAAVGPVAIARAGGAPEREQKRTEHDQVAARLHDASLMHRTSQHLVSRVRDAKSAFFLAV